MARSRVARMGNMLNRTAPPPVDTRRCATCGGPCLESDTAVTLHAEEKEQLVRPHDPDSPVTIVPADIEVFMGICARCREVADLAARVASEHPALVKLLGWEGHARHQFKLALTTLDATGADLEQLAAILSGGKAKRMAALLVHRPLGLRDLGAQASFGALVSPRYTVDYLHWLEQPPRRWLHLDGDDELRVELSAAAMRFRLQLLDHETDVDVPEDAELRGCMFCGVGRVRASSLRAHDHEVWTPLRRGVVELGGRRGPGGTSERVSGHLCPTCQAGATNSDGHYYSGHTAVEEALWHWLSRPTWARDKSYDDALRQVRAWAVIPGAADGIVNSEPWDHLPRGIREALGLTVPADAETEHTDAAMPAGV